MVFRSPYPDVVIPEVALTPFVLRRALELGDKPALIDAPSGRTLTYRQLVGGVRAAAAGLARRGFRKGDVFAISSPNLPEYAVAFHAVTSLGGVVTTANPLLTPDELAGQLVDSGARFLLTVPPLVEGARAAAARSPVEEVFVLGEGGGATPFGALLAGGGGGPGVDLDVEIDPGRDLAVMPYSSGTSGLPKGVMLTHRNLVANICQCVPVLPTREDDVVAGVLPFFHIYGMLVILNAAIHAGATVVTLPRFDLEQFLKLLQDYEVTRANLVPPIVLALAKHPIVERYRLPRLQAILSGAAPLGEDVARACAERLGCLVFQGYGLTETSPVTHVSPLDPNEIRMASIGKPVPNTECKIVDVATGAELGPNQAGELWIRGPQVMKGYLNGPAATAEALDLQGWLRTGDLVRVDDDGYFYVVDRLKELIKYRGYQVAPAELEALLVSHPAVADAAVIPSPDEEAGEVPKAFVVRRAGAPAGVTEDDLLAYVAERVAPFKKIRSVEFVDEIPKAASGKILRRVLVVRERVRDREREGGPSAGGV
jgi:acyl-CoA synthetase (AMP-forming)/AMP-acid ligase II